MHLAAFVKLEEEAGRQNGDAYYSLGILYLQELRDKEAKAAMQKAIDIDPSVPYFNNAMGDIYLFEKRPDLSIDLLPEGHREGSEIRAGVQRSRRRVCPDERS